jgi:hypothetical protein
MMTTLAINHYCADELDMEDDGCLLVSANWPEAPTEFVELGECDFDAPSHPGRYRVKRSSETHWVLEPVQ